MTHPDAIPPESAEGKSEAGGFAFHDRRKRNIPIATDRRAKNAAEKRKNSERRRLIDPTTCERDYSEDETEFMKAMDRYKRENRRPFPTWNEVLEVLHSLGYLRTAEATALPGGKREPGAGSAPVQTQPVAVTSAPTQQTSDSNTTDNPNNRRKRNIPVASDQRSHSKRDDAESEFMGAMDRYKRQNRRPFPTWSEVLEVLRSLGYRRVSATIPIVSVREDGLIATPAPATTPPPVPQPTTT